MAIANENFDVGGTGGALFAAPGGSAPHRGPRPGQQAMGDDYQPPPGLPGWKQPSYDEDDRVDADRYPEPTSGPAATLLGRFFPDPVSQGLALAKMFYFFFFAAFGSLFPLMAVYFKQTGMDAAQTGFLIGVRPIIEYLALPFWNRMAIRFQKGKVMLLIAIASWIVFTLPIGFLHPPVVSCKYMNGSIVLVKLPKDAYSERQKRSASLLDPDANYVDMLTPDNVDELPRALPLGDDDDDEGGSEWFRSKRDVTNHRWSPGYVGGTSPQEIGFVSNYNERLHSAWISPVFSNEIFEKDAVHKVFFLLMLLVIIGEFFSSPAVALADSAVITLLGEENQDKYGKQRMFGSIGWGLTMFVMGMVLDHSRFTDQSKCDVSEEQRNYNTSFAVFAVIMSCAFLVATQIPFQYSVVAADAMPMTNVQMNGGPQQKRQETKEEALKKMAEKTKVFAKQLSSMPEFALVFKAMANLRLLTLFLVAWVMGVGIGLIFTFLFWHLQELGGTPTLFGIASVINHLSEMAAYFYTFKAISKFGHIKILAAGLLCNCLRFAYVSYISWTWLVLPFEFVQGITHAAVWAACCSFITHNTDADLRGSAQGVLQGVHHGFGKFCGSVFGGMLIKAHGSAIVFRGYGVLCLVFLVLFLVVNFGSRDEGSSAAGVSDEFLPEHAVNLAPHGVPSAPVPRVLSSARLEEQVMDTNLTGPNLGVPGSANNPFLADAAAQESASYNVSGARIAGEEGRVYGRGYTQAQSGYSSSGFGLQ